MKILTNQKLAYPTTYRLIKIKQLSSTVLSLIVINSLIYLRVVVSEEL